jgi:lysine-specific demethylase/histidyl-hydroxylase NO66
MDSPQRILPRLGDPELFADRWPATPYHRIGTAGALRDLLPWAAIDSLLNDQALRLPAFRMARDNMPLPAQTLTQWTRATSPVGKEMADPARITHELRNGSTLVLQSVHRRWPPLRDATRRLSAEIGHAVFVNAFLTPRGERGFGAHFDPQHAWLVQLEGAKRWELWGPGRNTRTEEPDRAIDLRAGDVLWIPRGWWHSGRSSDDGSLHLTFTVRATNFEDVCQEAVRLVAEESGLARELPPNALAAGDGAAQAVADTVNRIAHMLNSLDIEALTGRVIEKSLDRFDVLPARPVLNCLHDDQDLPYHAHPEGVLHVGIHGTAIRVMTADADLEFSSEKLDTFWSLINRGSSFSLADLATDSGLGEESLVAQLLEARLICGSECPNKTL